MEGRVTSNVATRRIESWRGPKHLGPDSGSASGRTAVTNADEGVAPPTGSAAQVATSPRVSVAEVTHELVRTQLTDYVDGSLEESDRRRVDGHLAVCQPCTKYLATYRATVHAVQQLPAPKAPAGAKARILEQVAERARRQQQPD